MPASAEPTVHLVVSCKSRKTLPIPPQLHFSSVAGLPLRECLEAWRELLKLFDAPTVAAGELYAGDHWAVVKRMVTAPPAGLTTKVWIASAGYGLVEFDTPLKPYSATFIRSHAQSILPEDGSYSAQDWWSALAEWSPVSGRPRRLADLAERVQRDGGYVLLSLSEPYAVALSNDIAAAASILGDRLGMISVGLAASSRAKGLSSGPFDAALLPVEARLKNIPGMRGAMQGINARIADAAIQHYRGWFPSTARLSELVSEWLVSAAPLAIRNSQRMSDDEVKQFVEAELLREPKPSRSALLRQLRDSGLACEQKRFAGLYTEVASAPRHSIRSSI